MGKPRNILEIARQMILLAGLEPGVDIEIAVTGLRPGEKLYEELTLPSEELRRTHIEKLSVIEASACDGAALDHDLRRLIEAARAHDAAQVLEVLSSMDLAGDAPRTKTFAAVAGGDVTPYRLNPRMKNRRPSGGLIKPMRVTYYGQACTLIEAGGKKILTDPWLTEGAFLGSWFHTHLLSDAGVSPATVAKDIDYLFISHEHQDHLDVNTLNQLPKTTPVLICRFETPKFKNYLAGLGFTNILEHNSGEKIALGDGVEATIFGTAEYTNDAAILVEHEGVRCFNETDCKLHYSDLEKIGKLGIDIGFYMFSGANWFPMLYDYPEDVMLDLVRRRRRSLLKSLAQRIKLTKPRVAVPAAGPCTVLDPELLWLNSEDRGIFIDPAVAVHELQALNLPSQPLYMAASDVWDSRTGYEQHSPAAFRLPRAEYIRSAADRLAGTIESARAAETPAPARLPELLVSHFNQTVGAQTPVVRKRIGAKLGLLVTGKNGGEWTVDFNSEGPTYVRDGLLPDWTYKIEIEDKVISPFFTGDEPFFEDLLLSLRFRSARRPDEYNEPLYHFLYESDPEKMHNWYATR